VHRVAKVVPRSRDLQKEHGLRGEHNTGVCYSNTDELSLLVVDACEFRGTEQLGSALNAKRKGNSPYSTTFVVVARLAGLTCPGRIVLARHLCTPCAVRTDMERDIGLGKVDCGRRNISEHSEKGARGERYAA
jgi:hypothetical protein